MNSRHLRLLAVPLTAAVVLSACGGGTTRDDESATSDAVAADTATAAAPTTSDDAAATETSSAPSEAATANSGGEIPEGLSVAFLPKQLNNPYNDIEVGGGEEAVQEFGGEYTLVGPNDASASSQISYINTLIEQDVDVIAIAANDPNAVCPSLDEATNAGIAVVSLDSDTAPECRKLFFNQASTEGIARAQLEMLSEQLDGEGTFAILSATANATNQNAWIDLMEELLTTDEFSGLELVTTVYGDDDDQKSFQQTQALLQSYPDLDGIVSPTTVGISAAARYLSTSEYKGEIALTGLGTPNQMREFVKDGTVAAFALWDPADLGYLAAYGGAHLAAGNITGAEGETFTAGDLGEYTVGPQGEVILGPPTVFNADNIDDFDF